MDELVVTVPATVANLGPGFDAFGMAVSLENEVRVTPGGSDVVIRGEGEGELPTDSKNLLFRAAAFLTREAGGRLPEVSVECVNRIPLQRGLGSSSAAIVAGLLIANHLLDAHVDDDALLALAADLEGHADNVAPALRGGIVIAYLSGDGWRAEPLEPHPDLRPVLLIPTEERMATHDARRVLPPLVARGDASFNIARAGLLTRALTSRPELLRDALEDRLHQPARLPLVPSVRAVFEEIRARDVPVCVAGAGPALLAFEGLGGALPPLGPNWRVERVSITEAARIRG
ncbi:MAG: homoserine kinase [Actinobacteria bacterium]|nr:homoserine kinase [Actinomycetota bacterium]